MTPRRHDRADGGPFPSTLSPVTPRKSTDAWSHGIGPVLFQHRARLFLRIPHTNAARASVITNVNAVSTVAARADTVKIMVDAVANPAQKPGPFAEKRLSEMKDEQRRGDSQHGGGDPRGKFGLAEDGESGHHIPEHQRRLVRKHLAVEPWELPSHPRWSISRAQLA